MKIYIKGLFLITCHFIFSFFANVLYWAKLVCYTWREEHVQIVGRGLRKLAPWEYTLEREREGGGGGEETRQ